MILLVASSQPVQLVVPPQATVSGLWSIAAAAILLVSLALLAAAGVCFWAWRRGTRFATDPNARAFAELARVLGLSSSQRQTVTRLAGRLGPNVQPVTILVSRLALRRAVAMELEHKPEPRAVRDLQRLVEKLVGDLSDPAPAPPEFPARDARRRQERPSHG